MHTVHEKDTPFDRYRYTLSPERYRLVSRKKTLTPNPERTHHDRDTGWCISGTGTTSKREDAKVLGFRWMGLAWRIAWPVLLMCC